MQAARGFSRWLFQQRTKDNPIGDLATDAYADKNWPRRATVFFEFLSYLHDAQAREPAVVAFRDAWALWDSGVDYDHIVARCDQFLCRDFVDVVTICSKSSRTRTVSIYALLGEYDNPGSVHYVGQTNNPPRRLLEHIRQSAQGGTALHSWVHSLVGAGRYPVMVILDRQAKPMANVYEAAYIQAVQKYAYINLLNVKGQT